MFNVFASVFVKENQRKWPLLKNRAAFIAAETCNAY